MTKNNTIRDEIMAIVELLIEEKKLVSKIEDDEREIRAMREKISTMSKRTEERNVKAFALHKKQLDGAGKLVIKERL